MNNNRVPNSNPLVVAAGMLAAWVAKEGAQKVAQAAIHALQVYRDKKALR